MVRARKPNTKALASAAKMQARCEGTEHETDPNLRIGVFHFVVFRVSAASPMGASRHSNLQPRSCLCGRPDIEYRLGNRSVRKQASGRDSSRRSRARGIERSL